mmetsp:Transcript_5192/g.10944  ORF Transcript_5192/g.10944 Transcript_5192/m.10944 type:complete len:97 (+) Transcript_5192:1802-2092(+)
METLPRRAERGVGEVREKDGRSGREGRRAEAHGAQAAARRAPENFMVESGEGRKRGRDGRSARGRSGINSRAVGAESRAEAARMKLEYLEDLRSFD